LYNVSTLLSKGLDINTYITKSDNNAYYKLNDNMIKLLNTNLKTVTIPNITMKTYETE